MKKPLRWKQKNTFVSADCPSKKWGSYCERDCPDCLNGGICHDAEGDCVCPPGFMGTRCETGKKMLRFLTAYEQRRKIFLKKFNYNAFCDV